MDENFRFLASARTDGELRERIDNREKYLPETVEASVDELKTRGVDFSDEELKVIAEDMQARRDMAAEGAANTGLFNLTDHRLHTQDPDAPEYYSKRVIVVFSIIFSVLFVSVMLVIILAKTKGIGKAILVVGYGLFITVLVAYIASNYNINAGIAVITGYAGAYSMELLFWNRYIGASALYRPKPFWIPLIVGLALSGSFIYLIIKSGTI